MNVMNESPCFRLLAASAIGAVAFTGLHGDRAVRDTGNDFGQGIAVMAFYGTSGISQMVGVADMSTPDPWGSWSIRAVKADRDTVAALGTADEAAARMMGFIDRRRS